jgi:hypothetical protein
MKAGDYYNEKKIREGFQKIQEIYGAGGHFEMTPYPEFKPEGDKVNVTIGSTKASSTSSTASPSRQHDDARQRHPARAAAVRKQRLQHRGAQVQRQAAQPARLFQAARGSEEHHHREDPGQPTTRSTSR